MANAQQQEYIINTLWQQHVNTCCIVAASVVLLYDYAVTLDREIELFWLKAGRTSMLSAMYALARAVALAYVVAALLGDQTSRTTVGCKGELLASDILVLVTYTVWAVMSSFRVYALAQRRWSLTTLTLLLGLVPVAMNAATVITASGYEVKTFGQFTFCQQGNSKDLAMNDRYVLLAAPACAMMSDLVVLAITLYHVRLRPCQNWWAHSSRGLSHVVLEDGTLYFAILTILNAIQFIIYFKLPTSFVDSFMTPIILIFVPRFILDLQEASTGLAVYGSEVIELTSPSHEHQSTTAIEERFMHTLEFA
ncbi:hypothetical protein C8Q72DRAFT_849061 [Fomitopsis betulina]|nr:hypothetical protein C8Q72DRAFT_849061 [Fomitopsis betulina]